MYPIPVDLAARSIVAAALNDGTRVVTHIGGAESFTTEAVTGALRALGISCEALPNQQWMERVRSAAANDSELKRFLALIDSTESGPSPRVGVSSGEALLRELGLTQPPLRELLSANLRYLRERGVLC